MSQPIDDIPPEELGLELDMARGHLSRVEAAKEFADWTYADLDGYADGDLAGAPTAHFRDCQEHLAEAVRLLESEAAVVESRIDALEERLADVSDDEHESSEVGDSGE